MIFSAIFLIISMGVSAPSDISLPANKVEFELMQELVVVKASVEGISGYYLFDTGTKDIILNREVPMGEHDVEMLTVDGIAYARYSTVEEFKIGENTLSGLTALEMDLSQLTSGLDVPIAGIIGWSALDAEQITLDYKNSQLIIGQYSYHDKLINPELKAVRLMMTSMMDDLPVIQIKVRGESYDFAFDTGAAINVINSTNRSQSTKKWRENKIYVEDIKLTDLVRVENSVLRAENLSGFYDIDQQRQMDGVLSVSSLNSQMVVIDRGSNRIFVFWDKDQLDTRIVAR